MPNILIIDDDKSIGDLLKKVLEKEGHKVDTELSGKIAIKKIEKTKYDIIFVDIKLQDISGLEIINYIKKINPQTIAIIITGYGSINNAVEALNKGADAYINKPIKLEELLSTLNNKINQKQKK